MVGANSVLPYRTVRMTVCVINTYYSIMREDSFEVHFPTGILVLVIIPCVVMVLHVKRNHGFRYTSLGFKPVRVDYSSEDDYDADFVYDHTQQKVWSPRVQKHILEMYGNCDENVD